MGADNYNKVLTGLPGYAAKSPSLEDQGFIFLAPSPMQSKEGMIIPKFLFSK
jgi:hypothetical protein